MSASRKRQPQYESGTRTPKEDLTKALADVLDVSPLALSVTDIDSQLGLMHTLFALEDLYGLKNNIADGEVTLHFDTTNISDPSFFEMVTAWAEQAAKYKSGEISKEDYDKWLTDSPNSIPRRFGVRYRPKSCPMRLLKLLRTS